MKSFINKIPRLHLYVFTALCLFLAIQSGLRFIFWLKFNTPADPIPSHDLIWSFYLGLKFDLQASLGTMLPVLLLGWIRPLHLVYSQLGRRFWAFYVSLAFILMYTIYITDAGHYAYLQQRLNATALRFLENHLGGIPFQGQRSGGGLMTTRRWPCAWIRRRAFSGLVSRCSSRVARANAVGSFDTAS